MRLFGFDIRRAGDSQSKALAPVAENRGGWFPIIRESFAGAWQQNIEIDENLVLSFHAVYACITLIASDIAKLRLKLVRQDENGIWSEYKNPAYDPVLRRPNHYQNRIQFWETWMLSKLTRGNVYVLKARDARGVVAQLFILDPSRVQPMVADDGSVFYALQADNLSSLMGPVMVPAREIIHDRFNTLFHPLVGTSPIFASGLAATQGLNIQSNSTRFFGNKSMPGGVLTAPGAISDETAARLKVAWDTNYAGENFGKVAVLGDGLKFEPIMMTSTEAQLIEQLQWNAQVVCSAFHVPPYKIGVGDMPTYNNVQALNVEYYSQCLQSLIEAAELCMDEGLEMGQGVGTEFDLEGLLRMDASTLYKTIADGVKGGFLAPNEGRRKIDLAPTAGGDTPYLQQQNYSLAALAKRDESADPFNKTAIAPPSDDDGEEPPEEGEEDGDAERALAVEIAALISDEALRIAS
jgi:HK97 family phage portal protein